MNKDSYKGYRYPKEIIKFAILLYYRFSLSYRDIEEMLAYRNVEVSYETIRNWVDKYGIMYSHVIRKRRFCCSQDKWHLDEVCTKIKGQVCWIWRAIDSNGDELEVLVQRKRNARAARTLLKKLLKRQALPRVLITDKLRSYSKAHKDMLGDIVDHRQHKGLNNRIEQSHRYTRKRERQMLKFKSLKQAQKFLSPAGQICNLFRLKRHVTSRPEFKISLKNSMDIFFNDITEIRAA